MIAFVLLFLVSFLAGLCEDLCLWIVDWHLLTAWLCCRMLWTRTVRRLWTCVKTSISVTGSQLLVSYVPQWVDRYFLLFLLYLCHSLSIIQNRCAQCHCSSSPLVHHLRWTAAAFVIAATWRWSEGDEEECQLPALRARGRTARLTAAAFIAVCSGGG